MSDSVADFLSREQQALAGLEDDDAFPTTDHFAQQGNNDDLSLHSAEYGGLNSGGNSASDLSALDPHHNSSSIHTPMMNGGSMHNSMPKIEPEKMRKWREEQKILLEKKDAAEEKERGDWRSSAKKELDEWYRTRTDQLEKNKKTNRKAEEESTASRAASQKGNDWENISKLCEFNPKNAKNTKDVSRLRSLLLQLKANESAK